MEKKVAQVYYIDEALLESLAQRSKGKFFAASHKFYQSVKQQPVSALSPKQTQWLIKLVQILEERERKLRQPKNRVRKKFTWFPKKTPQGWVWFTYYEFY